MGLRDNTYRSWLLANPKAFVEGARGFCKQAQHRGQYRDDDSLSRLKKILLLLGGGYMALKAGDAWGRFAQKHHYDQGPVKGPILAGLGAFLPDDTKIRGTLTRAEANSLNAPPYRVPPRGGW